MTFKNKYVKGHNLPKKSKECQISNELHRRSKKLKSFSCKYSISNELHRSSKKLKSFSCKYLISNEGGDDAVLVDLSDVRAVGDEHLAVNPNGDSWK